MHKHGLEVKPGTSYSSSLDGKLTIHVVVVDEVVQSQVCAKQSCTIGVIIFSRKSTDN